MSENQIVYTCADCGREIRLSDQEARPKCCDRPMKPSEPLPFCQAPAGAEHSRADDMEEPCDDGRSGVR